MPIYTHQGKPLRASDTKLAIDPNCCCDGSPCCYCFNELEGAQDYALTISGFAQSVCTNTTHPYWDKTTTVDYSNLNGTYIYHRPAGSCLATLQSTTATTNGLVDCEGHLHFSREKLFALDDCNGNAPGDAQNGCAEILGDATYGIEGDPGSGFPTGQCGSFWWFLQSNCIDLNFQTTYTPKVPFPWPPPDTNVDWGARFAIRAIPLPIFCQDFAYDLDYRWIATEPQWLVSADVGNLGGSPSDPHNIGTGIMANWASGCPSPAGSCLTPCPSQHTPGNERVQFSAL